MGKGWKRCCVDNCTNTSLKNKELSFNKFPRNFEVRKEWIARLGKTNRWSPKLLYEHLRVCGQHFNKSGHKTKNDKYPVYFLNTTKENIAHKKTSIGHPKTDEIPLNFEFLNENGTVADPTSTVEDNCGDEQSVVGKLINLMDLTPHNFLLEDKEDHSYSSRSCNEQETIKHWQNKFFSLQTICAKILHKYIEVIGRNSDLELRTEGLERQLQKSNQDYKTLVNSLELKCQVFKNKMATLKGSKKMNYEEILNKPRLLTFYTNFKEKEKFTMFCHMIRPFEEKCKKQINIFKKETICKIRFEEQIFLVLTRLRLGLLEEDIAYRHGVSSSTVSRICRHWFYVMGSFFKQLPIWSSRAIVQQNMPLSFKQEYPSTRAIIDCTEICIEKPSDFGVQSDTYSQYKSHNTAKGLLAITPNGFISFISDLYPGRISDKEIVNQSKFLDLLEPGDSIMADRGFTLDEELLRQKNIDINIPPFIINNQQLNDFDEQKTKNIASLRIHVERVIGNIRRFTILRSNFPNSMSDQLNNIWIICASLNNLINVPLLDR